MSKRNISKFRKPGRNPMVLPMILRYKFQKFEDKRDSDLEQIIEQEIEDEQLIDFEESKENYD